MILISLCRPKFLSGIVFFLPERPPLKCSSSVSLLVVKSENSLFLTSFWKDLFAKHGILGWLFSFFLTAWLMLLHCHLIDIFSGKKILISFLSWFPVYIFFPFPLAALRFSFYHWFWTMLYGLPWYSVSCAWNLWIFLDVCIYHFYHSWKTLLIIHSNIFFCHYSFPFQGRQYHMY